MRYLGKNVRLRRQSATAMEERAKIDHNRPTDDKSAAHAKFSWAVGLKRWERSGVPKKLQSQDVFPVADCSHAHHTDYY